jgi:TPP-dependent pyruvate/acetoin dehydrogenase alpha subunit
MLQTAEPESQTKTKSPPHPRYLEAFRVMLQTRIFEDKLGALYRGGMIVGGVYLGRGQEAVSAACGLSLRKGDVFSPLIRDQAGRAASASRCSTRHALILVRNSGRCAAATVTSTAAGRRMASWR